MRIPDRFFRSCVRFAALVRQSAESLQAGRPRAGSVGIATDRQEMRMRTSLGTRWWGGMLLATLVLAGCPESQTILIDDAGHCTPGMSSACACNNGRMGAQ